MKSEIIAKADENIGWMDKKSNKNVVKEIQEWRRLLGIPQEIKGREKKAQIENMTPFSKPFLKARCSQNKQRYKQVLPILRMLLRR